MQFSSEALEEKPLKQNNDRRDKQIKPRVGGTTLGWK